MARQTAAIRVVSIRGNGIGIGRRATGPKGQWMTHRPWVGKHYMDGIKGQRIAVIGYSHWLGEGETDADDATVDTINKVVSGDLHFDTIGFFVRVRSYFGFASHEEFWNRVLFFNFLPECVGGADERYDAGTKEQVERGRHRVLSIFEEYRPHKALVFSARGWQEFPPTREERATNSCTLLGAEFPRFTWGTYQCGGEVVAGFGLQHPQFAPGELMRRAVEHILARPLAS
jgi:hypothetical protein